MATLRDFIRRFARPEVVIAFASGAVIFGVIGWFTPPPLFVASRFTGGVLFQSSNPNNYKYIDPLLACEVGPEDAFNDLNGIRSSLEHDIGAAEAQGKVKRASVYFRSLDTAHWFDINPKETYAPASLLKTFVMMAFYKESRDYEDPSVLTRQVAFQGSPNPVAQDSPGANIPHLINGKLYSIQELITQMIKYSDNDALNTLTSNFDAHTDQSLAEIFSDLQITSPLTTEESYAMSVDQYAMVFRALYSSTYLNRKLSEQALSILADAQYNDGLAAGVPAGVPTAHKFGITTVTGAGGDTERQLHDCGIVYYPNHPYLLCVMTAGTDFPTQQTLIATLSKSAYQEVDRMYGKK